jgi:hypothetical protein
MAGAFSSQTADSALQILNVRRHLLRLVSALFLLTAQAEVGPASARMEAADGASAVAKSTPTQPSQAVPTKPSDTHESPFRITLPEGAIVELIGVSEPLSADHAWWRPDGSPLTNPPVGTFEKKFRPRRIPGSLLREFAVNSMIGREAEVSESRFTSEGGLQLAHTVSAASAGEKIHEKLRFVRQIRANSRTTIVLDYAAHPWEIMTTFLRPVNSMVFSHNRTDGTGVVIGGPDEYQGSTRVMATYDLDDMEGRDVRIIAIDDDGHEHLADREVPQSLRHAKVLVATFPGLKRARIRSFAFQTRSIKRIEFRNVSLHPGQRTNIEIFVDGKRSPFRQK